MKFLIQLAVVLAILVGLGAGASYFASAYFKAKGKVHYRFVEVEEGELISVVNSTGEVQPVLRVDVGSVVSGPIIDLPVDFNDEVEEDQVMARVDPRLYDAAVAREKANLNARGADVERVQALLTLAENEKQRADDLQAEHPEFISKTEMDQLVANLASMVAQLAVSNAAVEQAEASLLNAETNRKYTEIRATVSGRVIDRKITPGQTMAAQFQAPQLFVIAPRMREEMHVYASVDEADIGLIREAQDRDAVVQFTVDAYPDDLFEGKIHQIRFNPTSLQNVVTYPVVVSAPNPDLKLLPGMTANISFQIERRDNVIKVPNSALRYFPDRAKVRPEDHPILDGEFDDEDGETVEDRSAAEEAKAKSKRNRRHVWVLEDELLRAVEVETGISDSRFSELVSGELEKGQELVIGTSKTAVE